ncbi:hypothetical protein K443DRAFT_507444 [Laccaria amethystina LaAM-08-1]|uniref:Uncharacterized protein n=1 Tax=Laccaria amethystina LaAM-08-1 TaxID=1095629 RepID=A0A0C9WSQ3_9AGAR|nr:hypothetical protein K443DRAFT_507444 [Laccaria amethystina LaAM-08-1]
MGLHADYTESGTMLRLLSTSHLCWVYICVPLYSTSFRPVPTARRSAVPPALVTACRGQAPWTPWYACLILVLIHMLYPSSSTCVLSQSSNLHRFHAHLSF